MNSARAIELGVAAACIAGAIALFWQGSKHRPESRSVAKRSITALGLVPQGAALVVTIDVQKVRKSPLGSALLGNRQELPGVEDATRICGFDPSALARELLLVAPSAAAGEPGPELALLALGDFAAEPIVTCASRVISGRGGSPGVTQVGSFTSVRNRARPGAEVLVREGGPVLIGEGSYLREVIDTADGRALPLPPDDLHRALRAALGSDASLLASSVLPGDWLERMAGTELVRLSPLAFVRAAGLRVDLEPRIRARALLGCAVSEACKEVAGFVERLLKSELAPLLEGQLGPGAHERFRIATREREVEIDVVLEEREAATLLASALADLRSEPALPAPPVSAEPVTPDEIVRPGP